MTPILLLVAGLLLLAFPALAAATSLRFYGNGTGGIDRVKIRIDGPARPADVGSSDFTLEWWMRALPGENPSNAVTCDANDGWITGNIIFDRDVFNDGDHGDYGVSLTGGRIAFGVSAGSAGNTICGETVVTDGDWHHVAVTREKSSGKLRVYVDGVLDAEGDGGVGSNKDVSYRDGRTTSYPDSDPFLVIGAEKHDAGPTYPSYRGWIDEVRLSTVRRYTGSRFTRPFRPFTTDGSTAALYHLDEGAGDAIGDAMGSSPGTRQFGGSPTAGPEWSSDGAPLDIERRVALEQVIQGVNQPVTIAHAGDDRLFVVEKGGRILAYQVTETPPFTFLGEYLSISGRVHTDGERGLLGLAFHPNFASNRYFFVYYTRKSDGDLVIARYRAATVGATSVDPNTESILLTIEHSENTNHNGGGIAFGPDGYLYAPVGDGGGSGDPIGSGQSVTTHLGKILRFAVDVSNAGGSAPFYTIPPDNPFAGSSGTEKKEIWAWGLRNPWRISFDRFAGDFFIGDVGQGDREEIDFQLAGSDGGANYGWSRMEGIACYPPGGGCSTTGLTLPILDYSHADGCSVTGGYRYRGQGVPTLNGVYVFGDYCRGTIWGGVQAADGAWSRAQLLASGLKISTFGEDAAGELYVAHLQGGTIHRFVPVRPRLTVTKSGSGTGMVTGPDGLSCGAACSGEYDPGQLVDLTATPGASSWLAGWSGACGGTGSCSVLMDGDRSVTATFNLRPVFQFSAASYSVSEDSGSVTITVQRTANTAGTASVDYKIEAGTATVGADFTGPLTGTLTFTSGQSTRTFSIPIVNDAQVEGPETILLSLHDPTGGGLLGAQPTAVVTIVNDDGAGVLQFSQATYSTSESSGTFALPVQRSGGEAEAQVTWTITGGSAVPDVDFVKPNGLLTGTLTFGPNATSVSLPLTLLRQGDTLADGPRTIELALSNPQPAGSATLGARTTATLTIADNDTGGSLQFSPATLTVSEAAGNATLTVTRTQKAGGAKVDWAVVGEGTTAVHGTDYGDPTSGQLQFAADVLSQTIVIPLLDPPGAQGTRTLRVQLSNAQGGATLGLQKTATVTITDDEIGLQFSQASYSASEGSASITIPVVRTGPGGAVTVNFAAGSPGSGVAATASASTTSCTAGADYLPVAGTLSFGAGDMSKTFTVQLCKDGVVDPAPKVVGLTLSSPQPGATTHLGPRSAVDLTINNVDAGGSIKWSSSTYSASESSGKVVLTAIRSGGSAGNVTVEYAIANGSATAGVDFTIPGGPPKMTFAANVMSQTLEIPIVKLDGIESNETFTVTLQNPQGGAAVVSPSVATVTIVDSDRTGTVQFGQATATAQEFAQFVSLNVTRTGSTSAAAEVDYEITGATALVVLADRAGTVHFDPGQSTKALVIHLQQESNLNGNSTLTVTLKAPLTGGLALGTPNPATVTLIDDEGTVQFGAATFTASEGNSSATITLTRTGGTAKAVTVTYATGGAGDFATPAATPTSCSAGADYRPITNGSLTFNSGETSRTFSVQLCGDDVVETPNPETLTLKLLTVTPPATLGAQSTAVLQIQENDGGGTVRFNSATYSVTEGTGMAALTVLRTGGSAGGVTVPWHLGGSAVAGTDYVTPPSVPIAFGSGQTSASLQIQILNDSLVDGTKTLVVTLDPPGGGATLGSPSAATLSINDDEPSVRFSSATYGVNESSTGATVTVIRGGSTGGTVTVNVKTTGTGNAEGGAGPCGPGIDFTTATLPVTFNPGETSKNVTMPLCPDTVVDGPETVGLALDNVTGATLGAPNTATIQIAENSVGGTVQFAAAAKSVMEPGVATDVPVLISRTGGSASGVRAHWSVSGGTAVHGVDYSGATSGTVTFDLNEMTEQFLITVSPRPGPQGPRSITLLLEWADQGGSLGAQTIATLWILDGD